jgi:hypothetical protein
MVSSDKPPPSCGMSILWIKHLWWPRWSPLGLVVVASFQTFIFPTHSSLVIVVGMESSSVVRWNYSSNNLEITLILSSENGILPSRSRSEYGVSASHVIFSENGAFVGKVPCAWPKWSLFR